jgi:beta-glucosidase/6-phospho-beta-glucosidase/beta-galactosidase
MLDMHTSAVKYFHKMLELAWEQGDERLELQACDFLGLAYYYAGDLEKSKHYNERMMRGKIECDDSVIKRVSITTSSKEGGPEVSLTSTSTLSCLLST